MDILVEARSRNNNSNSIQVWEATKTQKAKSNAKMSIGLYGTTIQFFHFSGATALKQHSTGVDTPKHLIHTQPSHTLQPYSNGKQQEQYYVPEYDHDKSLLQNLYHLLLEW